MTNQTGDFERLAIDNHGVCLINTSYFEYIMCTYIYNIYSYKLIYKSEKAENITIHAF